MQKLMVAAIFLFVFGGHAFAQPDKIRGYKIQKARVLIQSAGDSAPANVKDDFDSLVKIGRPTNFRLASSGATFEVPLSMNIFRSGGRVELLFVEDARVNGLKMQVEEFSEPFDFIKDTDTALPRPLKVQIHLAENAKSLLSIKPSLVNFEVAGRVLVFGTFKKYGFKFKRVIPVDFSFKVKFDLSPGGIN